MNKTIDLTINKEGLAHNIQKAKENNIIIPTIAQMQNPDLIPEKIKEKLSHTGLWAPGSKSCPDSCAKRVDSRSPPLSSESRVLSLAGCSAAPPPPSSDCRTWRRDRKSGNTRS